MNIQIIAPCFYPTINAAHLKYFTQSAAHHGILLRPYGIGQPFLGWIDTHITQCLKQLHRDDSTHVLFTDASDVVFLQGVQEIKRRYRRLGHPPLLVSVEEHGMNAGGWLAEREVAMAVLEHLAEDVRYKFSEDPQELWREAVRQGQVQPTYDGGNVIFQVKAESPVMDTCVVHFAGGFTSHSEGKQEQIEPFWQTLGYETI